MFGYPCAFVNGQMFAGLHQESLILRLSEQERIELSQSHGATPFEPLPGRAMREYVVVPPTVVSDDDLLNKWLQKAFAYASLMPPKAPKVRNPKKTSTR